MGEVVDFVARRQRHTGTPPTRHPDLQLDIWLDPSDDASADWSCLRSVAGIDLESINVQLAVHDAAFNVTQHRGNADAEHILVQSLLFSDGSGVRVADDRIYTGTGRAHALWVVRNTYRIARFMLKLAWRAWRDPIKSNP